jgi:VIT1/CCC1 family predicted Fe2+/Mn2+ transporter
MVAPKNGKNMAKSFTRAGPRHFVHRIGWLRAAVLGANDRIVSDLETERQALKDLPDTEREELAHIYVERGVEIELARQVATQLMQHDDLAAHARDGLGISQIASARSVEAALTSAASFSVGAPWP